MQHVNDDSKDELFRKSAEDYPLHIGGGDWEKLISRWEKQSDGDVKRSGHSKNRYFLTVSVLLLLSTATVLFIFNTNSKKDKLQTTRKYVQRQAGPAGKKDAVKHSSNSHFQAYSHKAEIVIDHAGKTVISNMPKGRAVKDFTLEKQYHKTEHFKLIAPEMNTGEALMDGIDALPMWESNSIINPSQRFRLADGLSNKNANDISCIQAGVAIKKAIENRPYPPNTTRTFAKRGFYVGATTGPEINQVKRQGFNTVTGHLGIITGYNINSHFSFETGLVYSSKRYFSQGQYFNKGEIIPTMPAGMNILSLNSKLEFLEIPIKIKWNVPVNARSDFFASSGISSALLLKEHNSYNTMLNGVQGKLIGNYQAMTDYFAAFFYISAGYEKQLLNRSVLRAEPYIQLPLKMVGQGSMPVLGAGLHVSVIFGLKK